MVDFGRASENSNSFRTLSTTAVRGADTVMLNASLAYVFADPVGRVDSGVTSYISNARLLLESRNVRVFVVVREEREPFGAYRERLAMQVEKIKTAVLKVVVEAPESDAVTTEIPKNAADIHIRLHGSRQLGALVQGLPLNKNWLALEQREISRASMLSSPSKSAIDFSKQLYKIPDRISLYPNPAPTWEASTPDKDRKKYVLFIGRPQQLKGVQWAFEMARQMPDIPFTLAVPAPRKQRFKNIPSNVQLVDGVRATKDKLFMNASLVVVPSLHETASMVGIEALAAGVPLVTWGHLGIVEYAAAPFVTAVEPYKFDDFIEMVRATHSLCRRYPSATPKLNSLFLQGINTTLASGKCDYMPEKARDCTTEQVRLITRKSIEVAMASKQNLPRWRRKLRKLIRNPSLFYKDSWLGQVIIAPGAKISESKFGNTKPQEPRLFSLISGTEEITFSEPPEKPEGLITAFLYSEDSEEDARQIIMGLNGFDDFRCVCHPMLQIGVFRDFRDDGVIQLINRIDLRNKNKISSIDHIILLDPPPSLVEALRSCGTRQRTVVILSRNDAHMPNPWHTDVLIVVGKKNLNVSSSIWRRKIVVNSCADLPVAIRRAIQEGLGKSPDMLLPLLGFDGDYREELLGINTCYYKGIIKSPLNNISATGPMDDIYTKLALNVTDIAVAESIYLRYRSLCDQIEDVEIRKQFLAFSLYDGVIFDVRT